MYKFCKVSARNRIIPHSKPIDTFVTFLGFYNSNRARTNRARIKKNVNEIAQVT